MQRAEMALLAANPSLRTARALRPGRRIVVPQVEGLTFTARVTEDDESIGDPAVEALAGLSLIASNFGNGEETARLKRERLLELSGGEEVRDIVQRNLGGETEVLNRAVDASRRAQQLEGTRLETLRTALDAARDAFEAFAQRGSGRTGLSGDNATRR